MHPRSGLSAKDMGSFPLAAGAGLVIAETRKKPRLRLWGILKTGMGHLESLDFLVVTSLRAVVDRPQWPFPLPSAVRYL
jgi:hypothetical protein